MTSKAFDVMEYTAGWEMGDVCEISIEDQVAVDKYRQLENAMLSES